MKISLSFRVSLILACSLLLVALALAALVVFQQRHNTTASRLPVANQAAALVELVEATPPAQLPLLLAAFNSHDVHISVSPNRPPVGGDETRLPGLSLLMERYIYELKGRPIQVLAGPKHDDTDADVSERPLRVIIGLRDGRFLLIDVRGGVLGRVLAVRAASLAFLALLFVGSGALWILRQQLRPLEQIAAAVEHFGERIDTPALKENGALEVRQLVMAFNRMQQRIRALIDARTRMYAAISHDLGTYLTRLRLRAEYIGDAGQRERAVRDIDEMDALMRDTLALATLDQDAPQAETVDLAALVRQQVAGFAETGAEVRLLASTAARVRGRASALGRVVSNLIGNAVKHAGAAEVSLVRADAATVRLLVEDRGPGIPPALRELVLEPFYRPDASRNLDVPGFGLGLAIVAEIVRRAGGTLALEERPGGGLRAVVTLQAGPG